MNNVVHLTEVILCEYHSIAQCLSVPLLVVGGALFGERRVQAGTVDLQRMREYRCV